MRHTKGFTLVEILFVVAIISVLAAISTPLLLHYTKRAVASEAVATMSLIRQALRDYYINGNAYYDIGAGNINNDFPTSVSAGNPTPTTAGVDVDAGVIQYFSNGAFSVDATDPASDRFEYPGPVDFLILVDGSASEACDEDDDDCAINAGKVANYQLEMDNSGRIFVSYDSGDNWRAF